MARIPIIKLNNGTSSYYPLSVGESTVTTHNIEVKNDIGGYRKGDSIPAVTTFDEILTTIFEIEGGNEVAIDNITITKNRRDELCVDVDEIFSDKKCDEVTATKGTIINSISQTNGKVSANVRTLNADDIPTITLSQVNGLEAKLTNLEKPLTRNQIPDLPMSKIEGLSDKFTETIAESRIPTIPISRVDGLSEALEVPSALDWGPWTKEGEAAEVTGKIFWDELKWKYKNDSNVLVPFDSGDPSIDSPDASKLIIGSLVFVRSKVSCSVVTKPSLKRTLTAEDSTYCNSDSSDKSIIGRIKKLEGGTATATAITEVKNSVDAMKFSVADTVELNDISDVVKTVKNILIKLGVPEDSITINDAAFGS